eukprot:TRINITY_DN12147_c1_g7_i2.p1 TRINITY_DN12147_c1_g7~~TRINITY_DN12147_c1_g7_i2.p1  ORF type:complete len:283 (+),score=77.27 TRINITY_DN12147_c1_g7_i2:36-884(+)
MAENRFVFVGNLSWATTDDDLYSLLEPAGEIVEASIKYGYDGRSRGCGVVEFATAAGANNAIATLSGQEHDGREIIVREDRQQGQAPAARAPRATKPRRQRPQAPPSNLSRAYSGEPGCAVYVGNLPWSVGWQDLKDHMRSAGEVVHAEVLRGGGGRSKGCGIVRYSSPAEAQTAIATLHNTEMDGRPLVVREDREEQKFQNAGSVFVGNLPFTTTWQELKDFVKPHGEVLHVDMMTDADGQSKGSAIVRFVDVPTAEAVIEQLNGQVFQERELIVRKDQKA